MTRHSSLFINLERMARASARAQRNAEAAQRRRIRDQIRNERESLKLRQQHNKLQRQEYLAARQLEADKLNVELEAQIGSLRSILSDRATRRQDAVWATCAPRFDRPALVIPTELSRPQPQPVRSTYTTGVRPMAWWETVLRRRRRHERDLGAAEDRFQSALRGHAENETARSGKLEALKATHERELAMRLGEYRQQQSEFQELTAQTASGDPDAVVAYFSVVLEQSIYPDGFPQEFRVAYDNLAKQLAVDYELPNVALIPVIGEFRFVKTKDLIEEKLRKPAEVKEIYRDLVAATALRCLHECFAADGSHLIEILTFNGFVNTLDPATGQKIRPYVISVRVTAERFAEINLDRVDTKACLRNLGAQVSPQPAEMVAVKPIVEFDMIDKRFIGERDVLSAIDSRPNLMDLTPSEFEALVGNLFTKMGLETKLTRASRDGGVDAVAFDTRPILGGKVVIQAKRYRHTVGVSAVRDLYGTMMNEGANKGILVATSSYGPDAYDFCRDKPIELIDGSGLLYHLEQVGVKARIVFPDEHAASG
jgi:restriction system protein